MNNYKQYPYPVCEKEKPRARQCSKYPLPEAEPLQKTISVVFVLDTCYLIRLANSGYGIYHSLARLSVRGDIIVTEQVISEFKRHARKKDVAELYRAVNEAVVSKEQVVVSEEYHTQLSEKMTSESPKKNSRVGLGEASIMSLVRVLRGLYEKVTVISEDSDVRILLPLVPGVILQHGN